ncbi:hypothetical protein CHS0354_020196 [Potamilus streckersoni]|uniref:Cleft lip and palate associated transmembrane protein n=1 Tax=Potamilus streckersoni TaxID=2493646 RepID=A0AAE0SKJ8_9BIVA|nr:hypothetical protein CHS0354_020196 [Potamilus streckersoni]
MAENDAAVATSSNPNQLENVAQVDNQGVQAQNRPGFWGFMKTLLIRMFFIYMISSFFRRSTTPSTDNTTQSGKPSKSVYTSNIFPNGAIFDMYVYISEQEDFTDFDNTDTLFWVKKGLVYGDWESGPNGDGSFVQSGQIAASESVQNNGSLYIHCYIVKEGYSPNPEDKRKFSKKNTVYRSMKLNKFKKRRYHETVNLLTGETAAHPDLIKKENSSSYEILSHWHPNLTINLIEDQTAWTRDHVPQPLDEYVEFVPGTDKYKPVLYFNDYWNLNNEYLPINDTTKQLNLTLTFSPISLLRWQMYAAQGMRNKWYNMFGADFMEDSDSDQDSLKMAMLETNPYLLVLTIVVSIVHSVFEFLAFKNDIQFWRSRKSLEGLSVRSVFFNVFQSLIVVLYVMDNETNTIVRISVIIGLGIEVWKIHKVINIKMDRENCILGFIPKISFQDKSSYTESHTKEYDMMAFKYLSWILFPLLICYSIYSLIYQEHKSWYSWVLNMLYGFLLTFGFIMMTPQLFINYKLKSVAHLPWRMMTYKALNTFIDDIFAFVIKMPTLYRIGCLRDDVIFFIYLYQRWVYRIDPKRVNEFGTSQEMLEQNGNAPHAEQLDEPGELPPPEELPPPKLDEEKKND